MLFNTTYEKLKTLISASLGEIPCDIVIESANLVNVNTKEIEFKTTIGVKDDTIVYVGRDNKKLIGNDTLVINAGNNYILPGFVETHTHIAQMFKLSDFVNYAISSGTTTVVTETGEFGNVLGKEGIEVFLNHTRLQPIKIFITLPPLTPPFKEYETSKGLTLEDYSYLLDNDEVLGLGEAYWPKVVNRDDFVLKLFELALNKGKILQAHSAGARNEKLNAYITSNVSICHEPITYSEIKERLSLGLNITIREGSVRKDFSNILNEKFDFKEFRNISVSTDGITASQLIEHGLLNNLAKKGVKSGIDPVTMVQMLTINPATFLNLHNKLGSVTPGKIADIVIVDNLNDFNVITTISNGDLLYDNDKFLLKGEEKDYPEKFFNNLTIPHQTPDDFRYNIKGKTSVKVRAVNIFKDLITKEEIVQLKVINNDIDVTHNDILKYFIFNRYGDFRKVAGFLTGSGINRGAFASTMSWENYQPFVIGKNNNDMAVAINRVLELNGGMVVVDNGNIIAEYPLEMSGFMSFLKIETLAQREKELVEGLRSIGCRIKNPFIILQTLSFTGLPFIRLTDKGLVDIKAQKFTDILID